MRVEPQEQRGGEKKRKKKKSNAVSKIKQNENKFIA